MMNALDVVVSVLVSSLLIVLFVAIGMHAEKQEERLREGARKRALLVKQCKQGRYSKRSQEADLVGGAIALFLIMLLSDL